MRLILSGQELTRMRRLYAAGRPGHADITTAKCGAAGRRTSAPVGASTLALSRAKVSAAPALWQRCHYAGATRPDSDHLRSWMDVDVLAEGGHSSGVDAGQRVRSHPVGADDTCGRTWSWLWKVVA